MLHKSKSKKINLIKYVFVIPLLAIFLMSFNTEDIYVDTQEPVIPIPMDNSKTDSIKDDYKVIITKDFTDTDLKKIIKEAEKKGVKLTFKKIKRNSNNEIIKISAEFKKYKGGSGTYILNGTDPIKPFSYRQNKRNFGFFTEWENTSIEGKILIADTIYFNGAKKNLFEIKVIGYGDSTFQTKVGYKINPRKVSIERNNIVISGIHNADGNKPLIIINGKESKKPIKDLNPNDIKSVTVLKGEQAIKKYGDKGKNGVVLISTKKKKEDKIVVRGIHNADGTKPLIIIDGKESKKTLKDLNPDGIKSVTILKGEQAIKEHGNKGKNGVVEIITKKD